jgi:hypothetical protein
MLPFGTLLEVAGKAVLKPSEHRLGPSIRAAMESNPACSLLAVLPRSEVVATPLSHATKET